MNFFKIIWGIDALAAAVVLYFFFEGLRRWNREQPQPFGNKGYNQKKAP